MSDSLNILTLVRLGDPLHQRRAVLEKECFLSRFAKNHNYVTHNFSLPLPEYVKDISFDAVLLTQSFLGGRNSEAINNRRENYFADLVKSIPFKIALPQDDYTCSETLDSLFCKWDVDLVYPACCDHWEVLYPKFSRIGRLKQGFTGYISEDLIDETFRVKPFQARSIDVSYRAAKLSPVFGRMGKIKTEFGQLFEKHAQGTGLKTDISVRPQDTIYDRDWYGFIENSKSMLGVNSGSSLQDSNGEIHKSICNYLVENPKATFEEIEQVCFPELDGQTIFTAVSPRNLECALLKTAQVLAPGHYGGFLEAWKDYIPLEPDMSNFKEVYDLLMKEDFIVSMTARCRDKVLSFPELRYANHVDDIIGEVQDKCSLSYSGREASIPLIQKYNEEMVGIEKTFWRRKRLQIKLRNSFGNLGLRKLKKLLTS
ncbi:MAG: hypothetical protein CMC93_07885 [Flavobacteriaceae bacterium]|nr:hypothetical protein [Flavobacteriaceae bacterium]